jgi:hypothetical protein
VGYGDFAPRHTNEKLAIAIMLLLLISIYSYNMNILMEVLADYKTIEVGATQKNRNDLQKWINLLTYINKGKPIKRTLTIQIEDFFLYYWNNDRTICFKQPSDKKIVDEIQDTFMQKILLEFLFVDFIYNFKHQFIDETENLDKADEESERPITKG